MDTPARLTPANATVAPRTLSRCARVILFSFGIPAFSVTVYSAGTQNDSEGTPRIVCREVAGVKQEILVRPGYVLEAVDATSTMT